MSLAEPIEQCCGAAPRATRYRSYEDEPVIDLECEACGRFESGPEDKTVSCWNWRVAGPRQSLRLKELEQEARALRQEVDDLQAEKERRKIGPHFTAEQWWALVFLVPFAGSVVGIWQTHLAWQALVIGAMGMLDHWFVRRDLRIFDERRAELWRERRQREVESRSKVPPTSNS